MTATQNWPDYLRKVTNGATGAEISRATGISPSTISRWLSGETKPNNEKLEILARSYPMKLDEAVRIVAAYQPPMAAVSFNREVKVVLRANVTRAHILRFYTDLELAQEIVRRIEEHESVEVGAPLPIADVDNVTPIRRSGVGGFGDSLGEAAFDTEHDHDNDTDDKYE